MNAISRTMILIFCLFLPQIFARIRRNLHLTLYQSRKFWNICSSSIFHNLSDTILIERRSVIIFFCFLAVLSWISLYYYFKYSLNWWIWIIRHKNYVIILRWCNCRQLCTLFKYFHLKKWYIFAWNNTQKRLCHSVIVEKIKSHEKCRQRVFSVIFFVKISPVLNFSVMIVSNWSQIVSLISSSNKMVLSLLYTTFDLWADKNYFHWTVLSKVISFNVSFNDGGPAEL